jgi:hypothetical protein
MVVDYALPHSIFEGGAFYAYADAEGGAHAPVHRFYDTATNTHFYTASEAERQVVAETLASYRYEGIAYYVDQPDQNIALLANAASLI